jgi:hypothetical protein
MYLRLVYPLKPLLYDIRRLRAPVFYFLDFFEFFEFFMHI